MRTLTIIASRGPSRPSGRSESSPEAARLRFYRSLAHKHGLRARHHCVRANNVRRNLNDRLCAKHEARIALRCIMKLNKLLEIDGL